MLSLLLAAGAACAQDCDQDGIPDAQQTFRWDANGAGFWGSPSNWDSTGGGIPGTSSLALLDGLDGFGQQPYAPFFDGFAGVRGLGVLNCTAQFNLGGSVFQVSGDSADCREFLLGGSLGADMAVFGGGQFRVSRGVLADFPGTTAKLILDGSPSSLQLRHLNPAPMIIGQFGEGILQLIDSTFIQGGPLVLGSREGSEGTIDVDGNSTLLLSAELPSAVSVGFAGKGFIGLEQDGIFSANGPIAMAIGERSTGEGELRFDGLIQTPAFQTSSLRVGGQGTGALRVLDGSVVQIEVGASPMVGAEPGSEGSIDVLGVSTLAIDGHPLYLAPGGRGELALGEGSQLIATNATWAFVDGVVRGSGLHSGDLVLPGGEIRPTDEFAETTNPQRLQIDGKLLFNGVNPMSGLFETGRMVYTLISPNPTDSAFALVDGPVTVDGTLRVDVPRGVFPKVGEKYPVIIGGSLTGTFDGVQSEVIEDAVFAVPVYSSSQGEASVVFVNQSVNPSVLQPSINAAAPGDLVDGVVTDVTGDGFPDLVMIADAGAGQAGTLLVARNLGVSAQGQWQGFDTNINQFSTLGDFPASVAVGDMNGDELPDIVMMNRGPTDGQIRIRLGNGQPGDFSQIDPREISVQGVPADITLADISGDGLLDVITVFQRLNRGTSDGGIQVSENDGGGFDDSDGDTGDDPGSVDSMGGAYSPTGIATTSKGEASLYVFGASAAAGAIENRGGPVFPLFFLQEVPAGREPDEMFTADLNGDGLDDIIASDRRSGTISVLTARDFGEIVYADAISLDAGDTPFTAQPGSIVVLDINDDGRNDLVFTARDAAGTVGVRTILNLADGDQGELIFSRSRPLPGDDGATPRVLAVADLDQNGTDDLVVLREPNTGPTVSTFTAPGAGPCNAADLVVPFGVLDLGDIGAFVSAFVNQQPEADLAAPFGVFDLADIGAFTTAFTAGCP